MMNIWYKCAVHFEHGGLSCSKKYNKHTIHILECIWNHKNGGNNHCFWHIDLWVQLSKTMRDPRQDQRLWSKKTCLTMMVPSKVIYSSRQTTEVGSFQITNFFGTGSIPRLCCASFGTSREMVIQIASTKKKLGTALYIYSTTNKCCALPNQRLRFDKLSYDSSGGLTLKDFRQ